MAERYEINLEQALLKFSPRVEPALNQIFMERGPALLALRFVADFVRRGGGANAPKNDALVKASELAERFFERLNGDENETPDSFWNAARKEQTRFRGKLQTFVTETFSQFSDPALEQSFALLSEELDDQAAAVRFAPPVQPGSPARSRFFKDTLQTLGRIADALNLLAFRISESESARQNETPDEQTKFVDLKKRRKELEQELKKLRLLFEERREPGDDSALRKSFGDALKALAECDPRFEAFDVPDRPEEERRRFVDVARLVGDLALYRGAEAREAIGDAFEHALRTILDPNDDVYTSGELSELLARIVEPKRGETVYDPTAGIGGTLVRAARLVPDGDLAIRGQEWNASVAEFANVNLLLHGLNDVRLWSGDVVTRPGNVENDKLQTFDAIVADLPIMSKAEFSGAGALCADKFDRYGRFDEAFPVPPGSEYAFFQHMLASLKPRGGRMAVMTVNAALARGGWEGKLRARFIEENLIDAVIAIPQGLDAASRLPRRLVVFRKDRVDKDVLFVDASNDYLAARPYNRLRREDVDRIVDVYRRRAELPGYSRRVDLEEIRQNDYNLNIPRYIEPERPTVDLDALRESVAKLEKRLDDAAATMKKLVKDWE